MIAPTSPPPKDFDAKHSYSIVDTIRHQPIISVFLCVSIIMLVYVSVKLSSPDYAGKDILAQQYLVDASDELTISKAVRLPLGEWQPTKSLNFGNSRESYWIKVDLANNDTFERRVLVFNDALIDDVQLWFVSEQENIISEYRIGDSKPFGLRPISAENFVIEVPSIAGKLSIFAQAKSSIAVNLNLRVWDTPSYLEYMSNLAVFHGAVYGYIFALFCYSMMMYATSGNKEYVYYAGYLLSFAIHLAAVTGHGFQYIWSASPYLQQTAGSLTVNIMMLFLLLFTQKVLELKQYNISASHIVKWQIRLYLIFIALGVFYSTPTLTQLSIIGLAVNSLITLTACAMSQQTGKGRAIFFTYVWTVLNISVLLSALERFDALPLNLEPNFIIILGFATETLLIGTALINMYRKHRRHAFENRELAIQNEQEMLRHKDELIAVQYQAQEKLAQQVQAQTSRLEQALSELSLASQELEHMRNVDGLTGLPNRYLFDEHIKAVSENCIHRNTPLSIAALDLDHFKSINDTHGHICGDHILKAFAQLLKNKLDSTELFACRFGGEEFIVVGQNKSAEQMTAIMEDVRLSLESERFEFEQKHIQCTVSIGVVTQKLVSAQDYKTMLAKADSLLYRAKENGRNQTCTAN